MNACRTDSVSEFLAGTMSAHETASFEAHVGACNDCQRRLEEAAGDASLWEAARRFIPEDSSCTRREASPRSQPSSWSEDSPWPSASCTTATVLGLLAPSDKPEVAGRIGSYDVVAAIGRGATGIVLRAFDPALHRNVAIKILDPALADVAAARQRFTREARAMASISSEGVVPVYEVSEHVGLPYFVMEYMPGGSLERRLQQAGPFETIAVVRVGIQVAQALAEAHAQGLVHRDIKPGNILLDRGTERVRVSDFGLVRVVGDASCTRTGFIAGTPQYMAPEQVRAEPCDAQSDLFSLGAVMYALCTGHAPFRAETVYGVMHRILHDTPHSVREQNPLIPDWLDEFILRLLAKDRNARFGSAPEVASLLKQALAQLQNPRSADAPHRDWRVSRSRPRSARRATLATIATVVVSGLVAWMVHTASLHKGPSEKGPSDKGTELAVENPDNVPASSAWDESEQHPDVLLWRNDGTRQLQARVRDARGRFAAPPVEPSSPGRGSMESLRQRLSELSQELDENVPPKLK